MNVFKRILDLVIAIPISILLLVPMSIIAICIKTNSSGPVLYWSDRVGRNNQLFSMPKFRSMQIGTPALATHLLDNPDHYLTSVGKILRRTSLDELPQLCNVIRGEMSLVGPRPVIQPELLRYGDDMDYFLMVRPGMTGLWQVSGRSDVDYETRVYLDTWYVKNWSLWYDIAILFKTIRVVMGNKGAY